MAVLRHIEVEIPKEKVTIERQSGGKPALIKYVLEAPYDREKGYARPKRVTIGHQCNGSKTKMHPTTQYADIFPTLWEKVSNERIKPVLKRIGMFTALQAINSKIGIRDILDNVYGTDQAGSIMDYAMYSILYHTNETSGFTARMRNELLFSQTPYSDSYYSRLFEEKMTQDLELLFRRKWALQCKEDGVEAVWLCIDGSNDDCQSKGVEIAEKGHAKSKKNIDIVSFTYAVTEEGKPVTYDVYRGGLVDAKAMRKVITFLNDCGISIKGVILDRGYCDQNAIQYLIDNGIEYIIMVKGHSEGYEQMVQKYSGIIKMNTNYLIPHTYLFGCQEAVQLFKGFDHKDYLTLFYDYRNGNERVTALLKNLYAEMTRLESQIQKGEEPKVDTQYSNYLLLEREKQDEQTHFTVSFQTKQLQEAIDEKGLYGIITSVQMPPRRVHELYSSRGASETQYMQVKTQLGYGVIRVDCTQSVRAKFTMGFVASIIRYEIERSASTLDRSVNQMVQELESLEAQKINEVYTCAHTENLRLIRFFKAFDTNIHELIDETVKFENDRMAGRTVTPRKRKTGPKKGSHPKESDKQSGDRPHKSGVKSGTKRTDVNKDGTPRKKPGVPVGTVRGPVKKDGTPRQKPGPKLGSHRE